MTFEKQFLFYILIFLAVIPLGIATGRAKAERLRELRKDFAARKPAAMVIVGGAALYLFVPLIVLPLARLFR